MTPKISAIVIAQPDRFRDSIQILLTSISRIDAVFPVENVVEAVDLHAIVTPSVVILESKVANLDLPSALKLIGGTWQGVKRVVLVENKHEFQLAEVHGADRVLLVGFNASKFISEIEEILNIADPTQLSDKGG